MRHQLSVFGLGKLGLPITALFARSGVKTIGIDINSTLIARLKDGDTPYVEPGLAGLLEEVAPTITYTTDARKRRRQPMHRSSWSRPRPTHRRPNTL